MKLDLLPYAERCKTKVVDGQARIWCAVRKSWLTAQPEEYVRQGLILFLSELGYPTNLMQVERKVGTTKDRLDVLVLSRTSNPHMLIEVKAPGLDLQPAIEQLARYNRHWQAPLTLAVNGQQALCYHINWAKQHISRLDSVPEAIVDKTPNTKDV